MQIFFLIQTHGGGCCTFNCLSTRRYTFVAGVPWAIIKGLEPSKASCPLYWDSKIRIALPEEQRLM